MVLSLSGVPPAVEKGGPGLPVAARNRDDRSYRDSYDMISRSPDVPPKITDAATAPAPARRTLAHQIQRLHLRAGL